MRGWGECILTTRPCDVSEVFLTLPYTVYIDCGDEWENLTDSGLPHRKRYVFVNIENLKNISIHTTEI